MPTPEYQRFLDSMIIDDWLAREAKRPK
jgi:hypothetical protein